MRNPYHDHTLTWWQLGLLKLCMLAGGIAIGAGWPHLFAEWVTALWMIFAITALYLIRMSWKQM